MKQTSIVKMLLFGVAVFMVSMVKKVPKPFSKSMNNTTSMNNDNVV